MKMNKIVVLMLASVFTLSMVAMVSASQVSSTQDLTVTTDDQCTTPTVTLFIGTASGTKYNESTLSAPVNTCVKVTFTNSDIVDHTFRIDAVSADSVAYFNIYTDPGTTVSSNFMTPNKDVALTYYCAEEGHEAKGMKGTLNVGSPSSGGSSPGFEAFSLVFGLVSLAAVAAVYKKKKQNI